MHGPTGIFWANLTPFSLQTEPFRQISQRQPIRRTSVWPIIQVFGWQTYGSSVDCTHWNLNVSSSEFPSLAVMRNMVYQSVSNGANGITFYSLMDQFRGSCCSGAKVRKPPSWPRSWANFSLLAVFPPECMGQLASFGPT